MLALIVDLRCSWRSLRRTPAYTVAVVCALGLAIGIGLSAAVLVDAVLLRPLPLPEADRVVTVQRQRYDEGVSAGFVLPEFETIREYSRNLFEFVAAGGRESLYVITPAGGAFASVCFVTDEFFDAIGIHPAIGRNFAASEYRMGAQPAAVITHAFWQTRLGGDAAVVGKTIRVGASRATVVGVLPNGFRGLNLSIPDDVFMPMPTAPLVARPRNFFGATMVLVDGLVYSPERWLNITAKLRPEIRAPDTEAHLTTVSNRTKAMNFRDDRVFVVRTSSWRALSSPTETVQFGVMLAVACGLVVLAGYANVAGMALLRNEKRRHEMAVRIFVGGRRGAILRLLVVEAVLLAGFGSLAGLLTALWLVEAASGHVVLPGGLAVSERSGTWTVELVGLGLALATMGTVIACGVTPALQAVKPAPVRSGRWRGRVLAGQVAVLMVLMIGATLFVRSMLAARAVDVGLDDGEIVYATVALRERGYQGERARAFYSTVVQGLAGAPGIESATFGNVPIVGRGIGVPVVVVGGVPRRPSDLVDVFFCGPEYVRTLGLTLVAGRDFGEEDTEGSERVAIVNESLAGYLWGGEDPLGQRFAFPELSEELRVIGVVRNGRYGGLGEVGTFAAFLPWEQNRGLSTVTGTVVGRTRGNAEEWVPVVEREIRAFDPFLPIVQAMSLEERIGHAVRPLRTGLVLLGGLAGLGVVLVVFGVYGTVAYAAACRRRELGIRIALGASGCRVIGHLMVGTLAHVGIGLMAGLGLAVVFGRLVERHLFEVGPHDLAAYFGSAAIVVTVAAAAGLVPAVGVVRKRSLSGLLKGGTSGE